MASDIHIALGPLGVRDYKKLNVDQFGNLLTANGSSATPTTVVSPDQTNTFATISALASGGTSTVVSYTVPAAQTFYINLIEYSGSNHATYEVYVNGVAVAKRRTYFGGGVCGEFLFDRLSVAATQIILLRVTNYRPTAGDFEGRILGVLV